ncbi:hypothetical protein GOV11_04120 [Candidatus Woesearchaeota archaeon]|nr:hypothetical protein [Candidatus Woesearchaeota archaeon]
MRFASFREFRNLLDPKLEEVVKFLTVDVTSTLRELTTGLTKISFEDNFESFTVEVTLASGAETEIRNKLRSQDIPTQRIIVRGGSGSQDIVDGDTQWTKQFVYLKNTNASSVTATVLFLR